MPKLADLKSRLARTLKRRERVAAGAATPQPGGDAQKPRMACQSLCLQCDARAPCTLGRLIG